MSSTINRFEDLEVWKKAREFSVAIHTLSRTTDLKNDFGLKDQINRAAGSVMDNIAEGFERGGRKEFIQFLSYSKGSAGEVRSQLYRVLDKQYNSESECLQLINDIEIISKMVSNLMSYLIKSDIKGFKFHEPEVFYGNQSESEP